MKIYGNPRSDGFGLFATLIGGLFTLGAIAMTELSGLFLAGGLVLFAALVAAMIVSLRRWDVMSEVTPKAEGTGAPVRLPNYPVAAQSDVPTSAGARPMWSPLAESMLPAQVETPKPAVETNALSV